MAYEIKSGATFHPEFFKGLTKWAVISGADAKNMNVIYGGENGLQTANGRLMTIDDIDK